MKKAKATEASAQTDRKVLSWMENASPRWLARKMEYRYFLLQPSLPPREVMVVRGVAQVTLRGVPANYLLRFFFRPPPLW
jgi:hypothetical protein